MYFPSEEPCAYLEDEQNLMVNAFQLLPSNSCFCWENQRENMEFYIPDSQAALWPPTDLQLSL